MKEFEEEIKNTVKFVELVLIPELEIGFGNEIITNPFSGVKCTLSPTQVALYDYIKGAETCFNLGLVESDVLPILSMAKDYFYLKWPREYRLLID